MIEWDKLKTSAFSKALVELPRLHKRVVLISSDLLLLCCVMFSAVWLRRFALEEVTPFGYVLLFVGPLITVATFGASGLYRLVTRYIGYRGQVRVAGAVVLSTLIWALIVFMAGQQKIPRSSIVVYALFGTLAIIASRHLASMILKSAGVKPPRLPEEAPLKRVLIYGAGQAGVQLLGAIRGVSDRLAVGFIDPEPSLWGQYVGGIKVYRPDKVGALIEKRNIKEILLALPATHRRERLAIIDELKGQPVVVKVLPALEDIASGRFSVADLRPIDVDDLLGRDPVPPRVELMARNIKGKSILVTGAGGSVGSELVRQIVGLEPASIVLLDISEYALYRIDREVRDLVGVQSGGGAVKVVTVLGSVLDAALVTQTLTTHGIETVFHAAAYKHVPIVEANPITGLENNVFGTRVLVECAVACKVERVVLISTDKAVRPTNVMGASKRLAELILQAKATEKGCRTVLTMVRFGNVLDSSGSVVALFRGQIKAGGPVTVTHPEVTRYFMSIPEAAGLVIQAGAMATGGEVFVLEMGEPVKIDDLARLMVRLTGLEVKSPERPDGDIVISYTGLRPGEKLYEELLIGAHTQATEHPRIMRSDEPYLSSDELARELDVLQGAMALRDVDAVQAVLMRTVEGYRPELEVLRAAASPAVAYVASSRTLH